MQPSHSVCDPLASLMEDNWQRKNLVVNCIITTGACGVGDMSRDSDEVLLTCSYWLMMMWAYVLTCLSQELTCCDVSITCLSQQLTEEDEERRRRRRERNKVAATKCRNKKKEQTITLVSVSSLLEIFVCLSSFLWVSLYFCLPACESGQVVSLSLALLGNLVHR